MDKPKPTFESFQEAYDYFDGEIPKNTSLFIDNDYVALREELSYNDIEGPTYHVYWSTNQTFAAFGEIVETFGLSVECA